MLELKMQTDLQTAIPAEFPFNFDELKGELQSRLSYYNGLVVTPDTIKESKTDRANLNKLREALDTRRKEVKKQCLVPYTEFEARVKELTALIDAPIAAIDNQLKAYDDAKKAEKLQAIREYYSANVDPYLQTVIPLERIQRNDWLNATKPIKKVQLEIIEIVAKTTADLDVLNGMPSDEYTTAVRAKYMETLDITATLAYKKELQRAQATFQTGIGQQETQTAAPVAKPVVETVTAPEPAPEEPAEKLYLLQLEFHLTLDQANALKQFLSNANISYKKI